MTSDVAPISMTHDSVTLIQSKYGSIGRTSHVKIYTKYNSYIIVHLFQIQEHPVPESPP